MCRMYHYHSHEREIDSMLPNNYLQLPAELSGSMAKNRFRFEMLWGIYHIFEIYDKTDDFVAIFDFVCDVEIYSDLGDEYYQIKTKKETQPYTPKTLSNSKVAKDGSLIHSILGKLYLIKSKSEPTRKIKLAVVSNVGLKHGNKEYTEKLEQPLKEIDSDALETIKKALSSEFQGSEIDLNHFYYIRSNINLSNPQDTVIGKMVTWSSDSRGVIIKNPRELYLTLSDMVEEKASYEWKDNSIEALIEKKGITKQQFDRIVDLHAYHAADGVEAARDWIKKNISSFTERLKLLNRLSDVVQYIRDDARLEDIVALMEEYIKSDNLPGELDVWGLAEHLQTVVQGKCPADYTSDQIKILALITLKKVEEQACLS